ncbi:unnamed protein product [Pleuronectes platessa]|uniref:Uncharacterized protein n=1 Tax=Pleuronectes platessa TaxID=8262 RepID=A0A9N7TSK8_PLEPL|nr:unnamed protein product [Pleuronectes platessa]
MGTVIEFDFSFMWACGKAGGNHLRSHMICIQTCAELQKTWRGRIRAALNPGVLILQVSRPCRITTSNRIRCSCGEAGPAQNNTHITPSIYDWSNLRRVDGGVVEVVEVVEGGKEGRRKGEGPARGRGARRQRGPAERGVGLHRQLESQVATGSLESEVGLENKVSLGSEVGLENKVSLGSEMQVHEKRPKVVLPSAVGPEKPGERMKVVLEMEGQPRRARCRLEDEGPAGGGGRRWEEAGSRAGGDGVRWAGEHRTAAVASEAESGSSLSSARQSPPLSCHSG